MGASTTPPVAAGQRCRVTFDGLTSKALGVGRVDGFVVMVRGVYPGDTAEIAITDVRKNFSFGEVCFLETPSNRRVRPFCPVSTACGGCSLQGMSYEEQLHWKRERVRRAFRKVQFLWDIPVPGVLGSPVDRQFRNKAQLPVRRLDRKLAMGFFAAGSHDLVPVDSCPVQLPSIDRQMAPVAGVLNTSGLDPYDERKHSGLLRHVIIEGSSLSDGVVITLVTRRRHVGKLRTTAGRLMDLPGVAGVVHNVQSHRTNVITGNEFYQAAGQEILEEETGGLRFLRPAGGFFQVNPLQARVLADIVRRMASDRRWRLAADLYCGVGVLACCLASTADRCVGVEYAPRLIEFARMNASRLGFDHVRFNTADADAGLKALAGPNRPDLVVVDPPRRGLGDPLVASLLSSRSVRRIIYVSCQPESLARDLKKLCGGGFRFDEIRCVDLFPHTPHVETVVRLSRTR